MNNNLDAPKTVALDTSGIIALTPQDTVPKNADIFEILFLSGVRLENQSSEDKVRLELVANWFDVKGENQKKGEIALPTKENKLAIFYSMNTDNVTTPRDSYFTKLRSNIFSTMDSKVVQGHFDADLVTDSLKGKPINLMADHDQTFYSRLFGNPIGFSGTVDPVFANLEERTRIIVVNGNSHINFEDSKHKLTNSIIINSPSRYEGGELPEPEILHAPDTGNIFINNFYFSLPNSSDKIAANRPFTFFTLQLVSEAYQEGVEQEITEIVEMFRLKKGKDIDRIGRYVSQYEEKK